MASYDLMLRAMLNMTLQIFINSTLYDLLLRAMLNMTLQILINSKLYDLMLKAMLNMTLQILRHIILLVILSYTEYCEYYLNKSKTL